MSCKPLTSSGLRCRIPAGPRPQVPRRSTQWLHQQASPHPTHTTIYTPTTNRPSSGSSSSSFSSQAALGSSAVPTPLPEHSLGELQAELSNHQLQRQQWDLRLQQVVAFQKLHGRLPRQTAGGSAPFIPGEKQLGLWCGYQRRRRDGSAGTRLAADQGAALAAVPGWCWGRQRLTRQPWEVWYTQVEEFVKREGRIPRMTGGRQSPLMAGERLLAVWCDGQRQRWKGQGKQRPLTPDQEAALEAVPGWYWQQFRTEPWEERYAQLEEYVQLHGSFPRLASMGVPEQEARLGHWCKAQRQRYKQNRGHAPMTPAQEAALEAVPGWYWEKHRMTRQPWGEWYAQVEEFVKAHGRLPRVSVGGKAEGGSLQEEHMLAVWCSRQRQRWKRQGKFSALEAEEVAALVAIPGWHWGRQRGGDGTGSGLEPLGGKRMTS